MISWIIFLVAFTASEAVKTRTVDPTCQPSRNLYNFTPRNVHVESTMARNGYERYGDSLYKFHTSSKTWENARRACEKEGAHLAIVNSEYEAGVLRNLFKENPQLHDAKENDFAFIGFHDLYNEGEYLTIFGEPVHKTGYTRWYGNIPDNSGWNNQGHPGEDCGSIHRDGTLNDLHCDYLNAFICEWEDDLPTLRNGINYTAGAYKGLEKLIKPAPGVVRRKDPGEGYEYFTDIGFYRLHTKTDVWENARRTCEMEGAHLAIVNSQSEAQVLIQMFRKQLWFQDAETNDLAFVGFHDQCIEGDFLTVYGERLSSAGYTRWWASHEPNNMFGNKVYSGQDCGGFNRNGGYDDLACNVKHAFFCEKELFY